MELPDHERGERPVGLEIGSEQDAPGLDPLNAQHVLEELRRYVQHRDRLTHQGQDGRQMLESGSVVGDRQVARRSPRGRPKLGQVRSQPLL